MFYTEFLGIAEDIEDGRMRRTICQRRNTGCYFPHTQLHGYCSVIGMQTVHAVSMQLKRYAARILLHGGNEGSETLRRQQSIHILNA